MSHVAEFTNASGPGAAIGVAVSGINIGDTLCLGAAVISSGSDFTITDDAGNTWILSSGTVSATTTHGILAYCAVESVPTEITVTDNSGTATRWAVAVEQFNDEYTSVAGSDSFDNGGNSTAVLSAGTVTTDDSNSLVFVAYCLVNSGRVFTQGAGFSVGSKVISTGGSGERAIVCQWRYASAGSHTTEASLNSGGTWIGLSQGLGLDDGGEEPVESNYSVVVSGDKRSADASVIVGGTKRTVVAMSRIMGGSKVPL